MDARSQSSRSLSRGLHSLRPRLAEACALATDRWSDTLFWFVAALVLTTLVALGRPANAWATNVSGTISTNTTWTAANSPYVMTGTQRAWARTAARQTLTNVMKNIHSRGSTAQAVLREGITGQPTEGRYHFIKAVESARALDKLIGSGELSGRHLGRAIRERDQLLSALLAVGIRG